MTPQLARKLNGSAFLIALAVMLPMCAFMYIFGFATSRLESSTIIPLTLISFQLSLVIGFWLNGTLDTLDPIVALSLLCVNYLLVAPILQLYFQFWPYIYWNNSSEYYVDQWFWLQLAFFSIIFFIAAAPIAKVDRPLTESSDVSVNGLAWIGIFLSLAVTLAAKIYTLIAFGGFGGTIDAYQLRLNSGGVSENNVFAGMGVPFAVGNAFPIAAGYALVLTLRNKPFWKSRLGFILLVAFISVTAITLNGLVGSRANIIYAVAMPVALYHFLIRRISISVLVAGVVSLLIFSQAYTTYKFGGLEAVFSPSRYEQVMQDRKIEDVQLFSSVRDFSRMDVQVLTLEAVDTGLIELRYGRTYLGGIASIIPSSIWPNRIGSFTDEKSIIHYKSRNPSKISNIVFGAFGEAYVNFGYGSFFIAILIGLLTRFCRSMTLTPAASGISYIFSPIAVVLPVMVILYDSNSLLYVLIMMSIVPIFLFPFLYRNNYSNSFARP